MTDSLSTSSHICYEQDIYVLITEMILQSDNLNFVDAWFVFDLMLQQCLNFRLGIYMHVLWGLSLILLSDGHT